MKVLDALNWRYAVKQFSDKKVAANELKTLLEATRLSASAYGLQPYRVLVIESPQVREQLIPHAYGQDKVLNSSHLVIFAAQTCLDDATVDGYIQKYSAQSDTPLAELVGYGDHIKSALLNLSQPEQQVWAQQQVFIALGNLLTCAALMKVDACPMTGFDAIGFDEVLGLADLGLTATAICPIGYRHPDDAMGLVPKVRKDYDALIMER